MIILSTLNTFLTQLKPRIQVIIKTCVDEVLS